MKTSRILTAAVALHLTVSSAAFAAQDQKIYPGAFCRLDHPETGTVGISHLGEAFNNGAETAFVVCPIVRDVTTTSSLENAKIHVFDKHRSQDVTCKLTIVFFGGEEKFSETSRKTSSTSVDAITLEYGAGTANVNTVGLAYYFFRCELPGKEASTSLPSGIASYEVTENHNED